MKYVYAFEEGNRDQKFLLGGKGANLAEMTNLGLPVPPGFTISTDACKAYMAADDTIPDGGLPRPLGIVAPGHGPVGLTMSSPCWCDVCAGSACSSIVMSTYGFVSEPVA